MTNLRPPKEMYELARRKLGSHANIIAWFFTPVAKSAACPQALLNINADFLIMEMLSNLPEPKP